MDHILCKVISKIEIRNNEYWKLRDEECNEEFFYPLALPGSKEFKIGSIYNFKKSVPRTRNAKARLEYTKNVLNDIYSLPVVGRRKYTNKLGKDSLIFEVVDDDGIEAVVFAFSWQTSPLWNYETIQAMFVGFDESGKPRFDNCDYRHPLYEIGKEYVFTVLYIQNREKADGSRFERISVRGQDDIVHEVSAIPNQRNTLVLLTDITCVVLNIDYKIRIRQVNVDDPYFTTFDKVFKNDTALSKNFQSILKKIGRDHEEDQMVEQYNNKSAFWVFTYCKKVLPRYFLEYISRYDYKNAAEINNTILLIEKWILKGGIMSSFKNKLLASVTAERVNTEIAERKTIQKVLITLQSQKYFSITADGRFQTIEEIYHVVDFSDFELLDDVSYVERIVNLLDKIELDAPKIKILTSLAQKISRSTKRFINHKIENIFELIENGNARFKSTDYKSKFFNWSYCEYLIYCKLASVEKANVLLAVIQRQFFYIVDEVKVKKELIFHSYYTLSHSNNSLVNSPFSFEDGIKLTGYISNNPNTDVINVANRSDIEDSFLNDNIIIVKVGKRLLSGFEVTYNGYPGFISKNNIQDENLKAAVLDEVDYSIAVKCTLLSKEFNFFVVHQLPIEHPRYFIRNNSIFSNRKHVVRKGRIVSITSFGLIIESELGQGLIHISDISDNIWDLQRLEKHFKLNTSIFFVVKTIIGDRKNFSLRLLYDTDYREKYNEFTNRVDEDHLLDVDIFFNEHNFGDHEDRLASAIQVEKAYCFEQFALIQSSIENKILNLKIASELFEAGKSLRSDYAAIYTSYFETLQSLEKAITTYDETALDLVNRQVSLTLEKITETALITFPDFDKLLYFLRILQLFNSKSDENLDELYQYVKKYSASQANENLKTIAKITLSNNLMVSAGEHVTEYSKRSLALIYNYIQNGVLSLKETEEDKLRKEVEEKIRYWRGKIGLDESSSLEFKSSLKTPVLDTKRIEILKMLKQKEQSEEVKIQISKIDGILATKGIVHSAMKSICAFANTNGGTLLIGVSDNKIITGIEVDYQTVTPHNRDGLGKLFDEYIKTFFGDSFSNLLDKEYLKFPEGDVLIVNVKRALDEVFILKDKEGKPCEDVYIRHLSSTVLLTGRELIKFVKERNRNVSTSIPEENGVVISKSSEAVEVPSFN